MSRCVVDHITYAIALRSEYERLLPIEHSVVRAMSKARDNVARAFVLDETLYETYTQKDADDARRDDWTTD